MLTVLTRHTVVLWGFWHSSFWTQKYPDENSSSLFRLEILIHPISSLAGKATWPQRPMPGPECLIENINGWLLVNPRSSEDPVCHIRQPVVVVAIVGPTAQASPTLMNKLAGKKKGEWHGQKPSQVPSVHPPPAWSTVMWERTWETWEGYWKLPFSPQLCSYRHSTCIRSQLFALCLRFFFKSTIFSFPRKTDVIIKNK